MIRRRQPHPFPPDRQYLLDRLFRTLTMLLAVLLVLYLIYHIGDGFQTKLETEFAKQAEADKTVTMQATIFRSEEVLTAPSGTVLYHYDEYEKVEAAGTVATVYASTSFDNRLAVSRINMLNKQIELLTESAARAQLLTNEGAINTAISSAIAALRQEVQNGRYGTAQSEAEDFYLQLSRRELQQSSKSDYAAEIATLTTTRDILTASLSEAGSAYTLSAGANGGYFTRTCDGYEAYFDYDSVMSMSLSAFQDMQRKAEKASEETSALPDRQVIGKLISNSEWYVVACTDRTTAENFSVGDTCTVAFPDNENQNVTMKLVRTVIESGSKDVLLIFSCSQMPDNFSYTRHQHLTVTYDVVKGLKVNRSAVRNIEGHTFVYILHGAQVQLRAVTILDRVGGYYYIDPKSPALSIEGGEHAGVYRGLAENDCVIIYGIDLEHNRIFS